MKNIAYDLPCIRPSHPSRAFPSRAFPSLAFPRLAFLSLAVVALLATSSLRARAASIKSSTAAGASLFKDKGCSYCHGTELQGTGRGPSLLNVRAQLKAAQIAEQIKNGGQKMPPFGDSLSQEEIRQLVSFLRMKHLDGKTPAVAVPATGNSLSNPAQ